MVRRSYRIHLTPYMPRASPWTSTKVRVLLLPPRTCSFLLGAAAGVPPPRRPARPRPRRAAAPAPVVSSLLAALIRTPLSCRPADLTLTRAIERVATRRSPPAPRARVRSGVGAVGRAAYYSRLRGGGGECCGVPHCRRTTVFYRVDTLPRRRAARATSQAHRAIENTVPIRMQCY